VLSLVIPVYKNEDNLDRLLAAVENLHHTLDGQLQVVFVVDGSPDRCLDILRERLPSAGIRSRLLSLSRNFGSFAAILAGLKAGSGDYFAVLAADLQEPPDLMVQFNEILSSNQADIVFGVRSRRADPWVSEFLSNLFWTIYRLFVIHNMPKGGIDVFGCTREIRDRVVEFREPPTNLIALLFWLGFRRQFVPYERQARREGKSAWSVAKKLRYSLDSIFNFTDLPIRLLLYAGITGLALSILCSTVVLIARFLGNIPISGYTPIVLAIMFFGGFTSLGFGITGQYLWLTLQNSRSRPGYVVASAQEYGSDPLFRSPESIAQSSR
jgi:glycosyltransferase involved in cell wall biosynthesis